MAPLADNDWKPLSDIQGDNAIGEYEKLANSENETVVECDYTGKNKMTIRLGKALDGHGYAYVHDTESGQRLMASSESDIPVLFQNFISYLCMRQSMVNSDPMSPDHFNIEPYPDDLVSLLNDKYGISIEVDY